MASDLPDSEAEPDDQPDDGRTVGIAIGIIMERYKVTADEALEVLGCASRGTGRPLQRVAADVVETGTIP